MDYHESFTTPFRTIDIFSFTVTVMRWKLPDCFKNHVFIRRYFDRTEGTDYLIFNITRHANEAVIGLYELHENQQTSRSMTTRRDPGASHPQTMADDDPLHEMERARHTGITGVFLNMMGRPVRGRGSCPRDWIIYLDKPPHIPQVTWTAMSAEVRRQHRNALSDLKHMPADLIRLPLEVATIEFIRRLIASLVTGDDPLFTDTGEQSNQRYSTYRLYTNQQEPIDLRRSPIWTQAMGAASRLEKENIPHLLL